MARLISYPTISTVASGDLFPVTDMSDVNKPLKNITAVNLQTFVNDGATLQRVVSTGNTYQASTPGVLWTWGSASLVVDGSNVSGGFYGIFSGKYLRLRSTDFPNYTSLGNGSLVIPLPGAVNTRFRLSANPLIEAGEEIGVLSPATSGTLALTTDITASPWDTVTGGINYANGNVGIGTTNPQGTLNIVNNSVSTWSLRLTAADGGDMGGILQDSDNNAELILKEGGGSGNVVLNSLGKSYIVGGNFGLGTDTPNSKCHIVGDAGFTALRIDGPTIAEDDIEFQNPVDGVILKSPDGTSYRVTVANGGTLTVTAV